MSNHDFSFLSEEERNHILGVLKKEEEVREEHDKQVEDTARRLKSVQQAARNASGCRCCGHEFGLIFNRGAECPRCRDRVCKACRLKDGLSWQCSKCDLHRELELETGSWFYKQGSGNGHKPVVATKSAGPLPEVCKNLKDALEHQSPPPAKKANSPPTKLLQEEEPPSVPVQLDPDRHSLSSVDATPLHEVVAATSFDVSGSAAVSVIYKGGKVVVGVRELKHLANPRSEGLPNPYYRLYLLPDDAHATKRISPAMRGTCWPSFNSQYEFEVNFDDVFDKTLWLSVWDDHPDGRDSFMGEVRLALARLDLRSNDLLHYTLQRRNIDLEPPAEKPPARTNQLARRPSDDSLYSVASSQSGISKLSGGASVPVQGFLKMSIVYRQNELQVYVDSAINLANPHRIGNPDPYVKLYLLPDEKKLTKRKTKAAKQTIDPSFRSTLTWSIPLEEARTMILHAAVYDHVRLQRNPFLGEVRLHLDTVNFEDATALEYGLCDKGSQPMADTHIVGEPAIIPSAGSLENLGREGRLDSSKNPRAAANPANSPAVSRLLNKTATSHLKRSDSLGSFESVTSTATTATGGIISARRVAVTGFLTFGLSYTAGKLNVTISRCIDLAAPRGPGSVADPYVKLYLSPDPSKATKKKTKAQRATLDPVFNQVLSVKINEGDLRERTLWLSVWDNNKLSRNTFLGEVRLKMSSVTFAETGLREIPLFDLKSPEITFAEMAIPASDHQVRVIRDFDDMLGSDDEQRADHSKEKRASKEDDMLKSDNTPTVAVVESPAPPRRHENAPHAPQSLAARVHKPKDLDATSLYSVGSVATMAPGAIGRSVTVTGNITLAVFYANSQLQVKIKSCAGLASPHSNGLVDPYVKCYVLPDKSKSTKRKTRAAKKTTAPKFDEVLKYKMSRSELRTKTLWVSVWDNARLGHNTFLGEVRLVLSNVDFLRQDADVFELQEKDSIPCNMGLDDDDDDMNPRMAAQEDIQDTLTTITERNGESTNYAQDLVKSEPSLETSAASAQTLSTAEQTLSAVSVVASEEQTPAVDVVSTSPPQPTVATPPQSTVASPPQSTVASPPQSTTTLPEPVLSSEPAAPRGVSALKRSESMSSLQSTVSAFNTSASVIEVTGSLTLGFAFSKKHLELRVVECAGLSAPPRHSSADPFVKVYLLPDPKKVTKKKTKSASKSLNPQFNETLSFKLSAKELDGRTLWASVWDNARLSHNTFMGEIRLDLAGVDFTVPTQKTFNLQEKNSEPIILRDIYQREADAPSPAEEPTPSPVTGQQATATVEAEMQPSKEPAAAAEAEMRSSKESAGAEPAHKQLSNEMSTASVVVEPPRSVARSRQSSSPADSPLMARAATKGSLATLKRSDLDATSLYSVGSVATMAPGAIGRSVTVTGNITLAVFYANSQLQVKIKSCTGLASPHSNGLVDPYVKCYVLPDKSKSTKRKTRAAKKTTAPKFDEVLKYKMSRSELRTKTLWVSVWDNARLGHNTFLGEVRLVLSNVDFLRQDADVFELQEKDSIPCNMGLDDDDDDMNPRMAAQEDIQDTLTTITERNGESTNYAQDLVKSEPSLETSAAPAQTLSTAEKTLSAVSVVASEEQTPAVDVVSTSPPQPTVATPPQSTVASPPQSTVATPPQSTVASPPQSTVATPPQPTVATPPQSTVASPPQPTVASPPQSTVASPPQSTVATPPQSTVASPPQSTVATPPRPTVGSPPQPTEISPPPPSEPVRPEPITISPPQSTTTPPAASEDQTPSVDVSTSPPQPTVASPPQSTTASPPRPTVGSPPQPTEISTPPPSDPVPSEPATISPPQSTTTLPEPVLSSEPAAPRGVSALKRSESMSSLQSTVSAFNTSASVIEVTGSLTLGFAFSKKHLELRVVECAGLSAPPRHSSADPFVKVYLLPDPKKVTKKKTKSASKSLNPQFNETLSFKLSAKELDGRTLWASVWDNARLSHNTFMGEIRLDLAGVDFTVPTQKTFNLQEKNSEPIILRDIYQREADAPSPAEEPTPSPMAGQQATATVEAEMQPSKEPAAAAEAEMRSSKEPAAAAEAEMQFSKESAGAEPAHKQLSNEMSTASVVVEPPRSVSRSRQSSSPADSPLMARAATKGSLATLKRSDSRYSVYSTTSAMGGGATVAEVTGSVTLSLHYTSKKLDVNIIQCDNLSAPPKNSTADPYVKLYILPEPKTLGKKKTKAARKTLSPQFKETLTYKLPPQDLGRSTLWVSVWDNAKLGHNTFLGEIRLDLSAIDFSRTTPRTFNLQELDSSPVQCDTAEDTEDVSATSMENAASEDLDALFRAARKEKAKGKSSLKATESSGSGFARMDAGVTASSERSASPATHGTVSDKKVMVTGSVTVIASYDAKPGQLNLNILGANNLATPHSSGQLNPYVKTCLRPDASKETERTTRTAEGSRSPTFSETISYKLKRKAVEGLTANISVWDKGAGGLSTFLGEVDVPLYAVDLDSATSSEYTLRDPDLVKQFEEDLPELVIGVRTVLVEQSGKKKNKAKYNVEVKVVSASGLRVTGKTHTINPFVKCYLLPDTKNKQKTPTVKSEVSATWEHTLVFEGALASLDDLPSRTLEATVWDFDKHSANDFLGGLMLGLGDKASPIEKQHWAALLSTPSGSWVERRHNLHQSNRR